MTSQREGPSDGLRDMTPGQLKGSARGALISAFFGSVWMYWAVAFSGSPTRLWFLMVTLPAAALTAWAVLHVRGFRQVTYSGPELARWMRLRKFFWIDFGLEWGVAGIAASLLSHAGRFDLIPQAVGAIVGLHFLPLAKIFNARRYYWTGTLMVLAAIGSLTVPRGNVRNIVGCGALGLTLWVTGVVILYRISSVSRNQIPTEGRML